MKAMIIIARSSRLGKHISLKSIAEETNSPVPFTAKILQNLCRDGLIVSVRGQNGGYALAPEQIDAIRMIDVVYSIDGKSIYSDCVLGLKECSSTNPCPAHKYFADVRGEMKSVLERTTIRDLVFSLENEQARLFV